MKRIQEYGVYSIRPATADDVNKALSLREAGLFALATSPCKRKYLESYLQREIGRYYYGYHSPLFVVCLKVKNDVCNVNQQQLVYFRNFNGAISFMEELAILEVFKTEYDTQKIFKRVANYLTKQKELSYERAALGII